MCVIQVFTSEGGRLYLSTVNPEKSNWIRYLNPANGRKQRNLAAVVTKSEEGSSSAKGGGGHGSSVADTINDNYQLHFVTTRAIREGEELVYWIDDPDLMWTKKRAEKKGMPVSTCTISGIADSKFLTMSQFQKNCAICFRRV